MPWIALVYEFEEWFELNLLWFTLLLVCLKQSCGKTCAVLVLLYYLADKTWDGELWVELNCVGICTWVQKVNNILTNLNCSFGCLQQ